MLERRWSLRLKHPLMRKTDGDQVEVDMEANH